MKHRHERAPRAAEHKLLALAQRKLKSWRLRLAREPQFMEEAIHLTDRAGTIHQCSKAPQAGAKLIGMNAQRGATVASSSSAVGLRPLGIMVITAGAAGVSSSAVEAAPKVAVVVRSGANVPDGAAVVSGSAVKPRLTVIEVVIRS